MGTHLHSLKSAFCAKAEVGFMCRIFRKSPDICFFFFLMDPTCNCHMMPRAGRASRLLRASKMMTGDGFALNGRIYEPGGDQWSMFNVVCNRTYLVLVACARESLAYSSAQRCLFARFLCAQINAILNILCGDDD